MPTTTWMDIRSIMLSGKKKSPKGRHCMISFIIFSARQNHGEQMRGYQRLGMVEGE